MELVSQAEFARQVGRTRGRVNQWISQGILKPPAVVKDGRFTKINPVEANRQLKKLDPSQQTAQQQPLFAQGQQTEAEREQARRLKARADKDEIEAERAKREYMAEQGKYVRMTDVAHAVRAQLDQVVGQTEGFLRGLTQSLAEELQLDPIDVQAIVDRRFKEWRGQQEQVARAMVNELDETVLAEPPAEDIAAQ